MHFLATGAKPEKRSTLKAAGAVRSRNEIEKAATKAVPKQDVIKEETLKEQHESQQAPEIEI